MSCKIWILWKFLLHFAVFSCFVLSSVVVLELSLDLKTTSTRSRSHLGIDRVLYSILSRTKRTLDFNEESCRKPDTSVGSIGKKKCFRIIHLSMLFIILSTFLLVHSYIHTNMAKRWIKSCLLVLMWIFWISWRSAGSRSWLGLDPLKSWPRPDLLSIHSGLECILVIFS